MQTLEAISLGVILAALVLIGGALVLMGLSKVTLWLVGKWIKEESDDR